MGLYEIGVLFEETFGRKRQGPIGRGSMKCEEDEVSNL